MSEIKIVLLFSGKRKSGKDYLTEKLLNILGTDIAEIIHISAPIKETWSKRFNLNLNDLMSDGPYKEKYRRDMIAWSEEVRRDDYGAFCREAMRKAQKPICIVSDIRRKTDVMWFHENYTLNSDVKLQTVRVITDDDTRITRGWYFQDGIDNTESECDLDNFTDWNFKIVNSRENIDPNILFGELLDFIKSQM